MSKRDLLLQAHRCWWRCSRRPAAQRQPQLHSRLVFYASHGHDGACLPCCVTLAAVRQLVGLSISNTGQPSVASMPALDATNL
jgi:hypothetical protein